MNSKRLLLYFVITYRPVEDVVEDRTLGNVK